MRRYEVHWGEARHPRNSYVVVNTETKEELLVTPTKSEAANLADELNEKEEERVNEHPA